METGFESWFFVVVWPRIFVKKLKTGCIIIQFMTPKWEDYFISWLLTHEISHITKHSMFFNNGKLLKEVYKILFWENFTENRKGALARNMKKSNIKGTVHSISQRRFSCSCLAGIRLSIAITSKLVTIYAKWGGKKDNIKTIDRNCSMFNG